VGTHLKGPVTVLLVLVSHSEGARWAGREHGGWWGTRRQMAVVVVMRKQLWQVTWDHHACNLWQSFEFMHSTPENANDTFLPGVSLLIWCVILLICVCVSPLVHPLEKSWSISWPPTRPTVRCTEWQMDTTGLSLAWITLYSRMGIECVVLALCLIQAWLGGCWEVVQKFATNQEQGHRIVQREGS